MFRSQKEKTFSLFVFIIYLLLLIWLVLFKFSTSLSQLPNIRSLNFIPFYYAQETPFHLKETMYNFVIFIPLGMFLQLFKSNRKIIFKILIVLLVSLTFELTQYVFSIGASDITDIITNTSGGLIGIIIIILAKKFAPKKYISIFNVLLFVIEILLIGLLTILLISNK